MSRTAPLLSGAAAAAAGLPLDWAEWTDGTAPAGEHEGPIFLFGLDDLLTRLETLPSFQPPDPTGDTLEALAAMLTDAGLGR